MANLIYSTNTSKSFATNFKVATTRPLDARLVVLNIEQLYNKDTFDGNVYEGMVVAVLEDKSLYQLIRKDDVHIGSFILEAFDTINLSNNSVLWKKIGSDVDLSNYFTKNELKDKLINIATTPNHINSFVTGKYNGILLVKNDIGQITPGLYLLQNGNLVKIIDVSSLEEKLNTLIENDSDKSIRTIASEVMEELLDMDAEDLAALKLLLESIKNEGDDSILNRLSDLEQSVDKLGKLTSDFTVTGVTVGNLTNGTKFAKDTSIESILKQMLMKVIDVKAILPTGKLLFNNKEATSETVEMGSEFTKTLGNTFTDGKFTGNSGYNYTLAAGCTQTGVIFYDGSDVVNANYSKVIKSTTKLKATVSYSANANTPKKNTGDNSDVTIPAGSFTAQLSNNQPVTITPAYYTFYKTFASGAKETDPPVSSADAVTKGYDKSFKAPTEFGLNVAAENSFSKIVIYTRGTIKNVFCDIPPLKQDWTTSNTTKTTVTINLPNGSGQVDYNKYVIATPDDSNLPVGTENKVSITYN